MKLFVDDIRKAPDESWTVAQNVSAAVRLLEAYWPQITEVSLDHDISHYENLDENDVDQNVQACGEDFQAVARYMAMVRKYTLAQLVTDARYSKAYQGFNPKITVHTSNHEGAQRISDILKAASFTDIYTI